MRPFSALNLPRLDCHRHIGGPKIRCQLGPSRLLTRWSHLQSPTTKTGRPSIRHVPVVPDRWQPHLSLPTDYPSRFVLPIPQSPNHVSQGKHGHTTEQPSTHQPFPLSFIDSRSSASHPFPSSFPFQRRVSFQIPNPPPIDLGHRLSLPPPPLTPAPLASASAAAVALIVVVAAAAAAAVDAAVASWCL
jgi:hypothetical protein